MAGQNTTSQRYSDSVRVAALARYDLTRQVRATAREFGIPQGTLSWWIKGRQEGRKDIAALEERIEHSKKYMIYNSKNVMSKALQVIDAKIESCNAVQAATIYGILFDKVRVMEGNAAEPGQTVNNTIIMSMPAEEQAGLLSRVAERMLKKEPIEAVAEVLGEAEPGPETGED